MSHPFDNHNVVDRNILRLGLKGFRPNKSAVANVENGVLEVRAQFDGKQYLFVSNNGVFPANGLLGNPVEHRDYIDVRTNVPNLRTFL